MAFVYAVTHVGFGKRAALKLCHPTALTEKLALEMFLREARVVNLIDHANVPDVFATGTYDRRPYLVMERLHGKTLGEYFGSSVVEITKAHALDILFEICGVMAAAHSQGVVHRDIKLDNVFIIDTPAGAPPQIKVLDWGVAKILAEPDPIVGMVAGTLTYMAPEQLRDGDITTAADVYSLGVLAYQLLFGQPPFAHQSDRELIGMHLKLPPPQPVNLWPEIPAELHNTMLAMLAKEPTQRPAIEDVLRVVDAARREPAPLRLLEPPTLLRFAHAVRGFVTRLKNTLATNDYEIIEVIEIPDDELAKQAL